MSNLRRAFTLIELLVVIAIIAVLAAILFPVFAQARVTAKTANCVSNLRQLGTGLHLYHQDYDDRFPFAIDFSDEILDWSGWAGIYPEVVANITRLKAQKDPIDGDVHGGRVDHVMRSYTTDETLWRCPADTGFGGVGYAAYTGPYILVNKPPYVPVWQQSRNHNGHSKWGGTSYFYRTELAWAQKPVNRLYKPSNVNVFMDASHYWHNRLHRRPIYSTGSVNKDMADAEKGSYSILFADGHAANLSWQEYVDAWTKAWRPNTYDLFN